MKKIFTIVSLTVLILALFFFFPGKITQSGWDSTQESCGQAPLGGCFSSCVGKYYPNECTRTSPSSCAYTCSGTCYGLVLGSCGVNPISAKVKFITDLMEN